MNRLERLEELKLYAEKQIDDGKDYDMKYCDFRDLAIRETHRIESSRKVPLIPCKHCRKKPDQHRYGQGKGIQYYYFCMCKPVASCSAKTDREARLAWNEKMGKDGAENGL